MLVLYAVIWMRTAFCCFTTFTYDLQDLKSLWFINKVSYLYYFWRRVSWTQKWLRLYWGLRCCRKSRFPSSIQFEILTIENFHSGQWWSKGHYIWFFFNKLRNCRVTQIRRTFFGEWFLLFKECQTIPRFT